MTEYRVVNFTVKTAGFFHPEPGSAAIQTVGFANSLPELAEHMDGWDVVTSQIIPMGEVTIMSFTLKTEIAAPIN